MRFLRQLQREEGIALVMALGMLIVITVVGTTALYYTTANQRSATNSQGSTQAYSLAEAGVAEALSKMAIASNPVNTNLLPPTTITLEGGTATYSGTLVGRLWTITSTGKIRNASGVPTADVQRTMVQEVNIESMSIGSVGSPWDRIYNDRTSDANCDVTFGSTAQVLGSPFAARGDVCLQSSAVIKSDVVDIGGKLTLSGAATGVGLSGTPIQIFRIAGTCKYMSQAASASPCSSYDHVYSNSYDSTNGNLAKPTADFAYWFENAKPGPKQGCTESSGTPPSFDSTPPASSTYDNSLGEQELTPRTASYTCKVRDANGDLVGELSWNHTTKVLTVKGTIFFDGDLGFRDDDDVNNYTGRAVIYASGKWHNDEVMCASATGTTNCRTSGMTSWDPQTNLLVLAVGGLVLAGVDAIHFHKTSAFQGILYSARDCKIDNNPYMSGPLICDEIDPAGGNPVLHTWPTLPPPEQGQLYGQSNAPGTDFNLTLGKQSG